jgi:peptide/nickel transport system permease protein
MFRYLLHKFFYSILVLWGVASLVFFLFNVIPGDPARMVLGQRSDSASLAAVRVDLGLDRPVISQYFKYINDLSPISFHNTNINSYWGLKPELYGKPIHLVTISNCVIVLKAPYLRRSYQDRRNVSETIAETMPNTLILALAAILLATVVGILWGILCGLYKDSWFDRLSALISSLGMAIPSFFAAILFGWIFAFLLGPYTGLNLTGNLYVVDDLGNGPYPEWKNLILPAFTLGIRPLAVVVQLMRNSLLEELSQDYVRTAKAKGAGTARIVFVHAFRGALNPVVTALSGWFASMMAGVVFIEYIFGWKGLGYVMVGALNNFDLPVVMSCVLVISVIFVIVNFFVDLAYGWLDPRVRTS